MSLKNTSHYFFNKISEHSFRTHTFSNPILNHIHFSQNNISKIVENKTKLHKELAFFPPKTKMTKSKETKCLEFIWLIRL